MEPGSSLGHYRIVRLLGRGGMGEVYEALDERLGRSVALKVLPAELAEEPERRARLEREAKAAAALQHPNIVTLHALEEDGGRLFLVMELVAGRPLSELVPSGGLEIERFLDLAVPLADAVAAAHARGIVHRDLKPANVLVDGDGRVRVLDFGLARIEEVGLTGTETAGPTEALTGGGRIVGTLAYMSPEQAEGKPVDARTDLFSLGVVLYEMATGERPFTGDTGMSILTSILRDEPVSVTERNTRLPRHLGRIVRRCLQKDPGRRYQSALDLRNDLLELREDLASGELTAGGSAAVATAPSPRRLPFVLLAAGVVALVAVAVFRIRGGDEPGPAPEVRQTRRLTTVGDPQEAAISPDGRTVAYESQRGERRTIRLHQVSTGSDVELLADVGRDFALDSLAFTPDGDRVRYRLSEVDGGSIWEVPSLGGEPRRLLDHVVHEVSFSPDGRWVAAVRGEDVAERWNRLEVVSLEDGGVRSRFELEDVDFAQVAWSPDGNRLAAAMFEHGSNRLVTMDVDGGPIEPLEASERFEFGDTLCWEPDGRSLLMAAVPAGRSNAQLWRVDIASGAVVRLTHDVDGYDGCSLTADGRTLATVRDDFRSELWRVPVERPLEAAPIRTSTGRRDGADGISWLGDDTIVYSAPSEPDWAIWTVPADGGTSRRLTTAEGSMPYVDRRGERMVFISGWLGADSSPGVFTASADGSASRRITPATRYADRPSVSPDGAWLFYEELQDDRMVLMRRPWEGGEAERFVEGLAHAVSHSPDGSRLAVHVLDAETESWKTAIYGADLDEPVAVLDVHSDSYSPWASDDALYLTRTVGGVGNVYRIPVDDPAAEEQVTRFTEERIFGLDVSPDLTRLVVARGESTNDLLLLEVPGRAGAVPE
ncbi:MAG: protein kinase [Thermoanaerobaculia bacterium]